MTVLGGYFAEHLQELRRRVLVCFCAVAVGSALAYFFAENIMRFLAVPLYRARPELGRLVYTNLTEAFLTYLQVALLAGVIGAFPIVCYQLWMFVAPGLHAGEKRFVRLVSGWGTLLFVGGVCFAYYVAMPLVLSFLLGFAGPDLTAMPRLDAYLTFVIRASLALGIAFEIPFLMVMAARGGLVRREYFPQQRRYFYLAILVVAFLLTVGDILTTAMLAIPLVGLYEAGILVSRVFSPPA